MSVSDEGFFSEAQMDRMNAKTISDPFPSDIDSHDALAMLIHQSMSLGIQVGLEEAKEKVCDWYCKSPTRFLLPQIELTKRAGINIQKLKQAMEFANRQSTQND